MIYPPAYKQHSMKRWFTQQLLTSQQNMWMVYPTELYKHKTRDIWFTQHTDENMTNEVTDLPKQW